MDTHCLSWTVQTVQARSCMQPLLRGGSLHVPACPASSSGRSVVPCAVSSLKPLPKGLSATWSQDQSPITAPTARQQLRIQPSQSRGRWLAGAQAAPQAAEEQQSPNPNRHLLLLTLALCLLAWQCSPARHSAVLFASVQATAGPVARKGAVQCLRASTCTANKGVIECCPAQGLPISPPVHGPAWLRAACTLLSGPDHLAVRLPCWVVCCRRVRPTVTSVSLPGPHPPHSRPWAAQGNLAGGALGLRPLSGPARAGAAAPPAQGAP